MNARWCYFERLPRQFADLAFEFNHFVETSGGLKSYVEKIVPEIAFQNFPKVWRDRYKS